MQQNYTVIKLAKKDEAEYDVFIKELSKNNASLLGYHYNFYKNALQNCGIGDPFYLALFNEDKLCAVLPGFIKTSSIGTVYSSMPFFGPNAGILALPNYDNVEVHQLMFKFLFDELQKLENILSASVYTPFLSTKKDMYREIIAPNFTIDKGTQYIEIQQTEWTSKIKYDLRKAEKLGLTLTTEITDETVGLLYKIYLQNCVDYSIPPKPKQFIDELATASKNGENVDFCFTYFEGEMVGGLIVVYSQSTLSYYLPCTLDSARTIQPVTVMIDYAFKKAKQNGLQYWNWESSPNVESGVYKFKKKWGSIESDYQILIKTFKEPDYFKSLGKEKIAENFPYFFVFPFHLM